MKKLFIGFIIAILAQPPVFAHHNIGLQIWIGNLPPPVYWVQGPIYVAPAPQICQEWRHVWYRYPNGDQVYLGVQLVQVPCTFR